ncbi:MAG: hypothetical protein F6J87_14890 [Spirulina sp. SIO3F2]|nr:hypothetical protein [Spirulina sp. SIO3F2]
MEIVKSEVQDKTNNTQSNPQQSSIQPPPNSKPVLQGFTIHPRLLRWGGAYATILITIGLLFNQCSRPPVTAEQPTEPKPITQEFPSTEEILGQSHAMSTEELLHYTIALGERLEQEIKCERSEEFRRDAVEALGRGIPLEVSLLKKLGGVTERLGSELTRQTVFAGTAEQVKVARASIGDVQAALYAVMLQRTGEQHQVCDTGTAEYYATANKLLQRLAYERSLTIEQQIRNELKANRQATPQSPTNQARFEQGVINGQH